MAVLVKCRGGGTVIGHTYVANSKADGYTLLSYTNAVVNNPQLKEVTYTHRPGADRVDRGPHLPHRD